MHTAACKEFYANLIVFIYKKKEIARSRVRGVEIEFDSMKLASILNVPGHTVAEVPVVPAFPASPRDSTTQQKEPEAVGFDPSDPSGDILESVMIKLQAEFERVRANRIQADLEKVQAENARLLALLQQTKSQPKPLEFYC
ncbi:hypothetical protein Dimus_028690 [Dionaea muscipula]